MSRSKTRLSKRTEAAYRIGADGSVKGVYSDILQERGLQLKVERFSNVELNHSTQRWEAELVTPFADHKQGEILCSAPTREECLVQEHKLLVESLLHTS